MDYVIFACDDGRVIHALATCTRQSLPFGGSRSLVAKRSLQTQWPSPANNGLLTPADTMAVALPSDVQAIVPLATVRNMDPRAAAGLRPKGRRLSWVVAAIRGAYTQATCVSARLRCSTWCGLQSYVLSTAVGSRVHSASTERECTEQNHTKQNTTGDRSEQTWLCRTKRCGSRCAVGPHSKCWRR
jgi:hypothetical protein